MELSTRGLENREQWEKAGYKLPAFDREIKNFFTDFSLAKKFGMVLFYLLAQKNQGLQHKIRYRYKLVGFQ